MRVHSFTLGLLLSTLVGQSAFAQPDLESAPPEEELPPEPEPAPAPPPPPPPPVMMASAAPVPVTGMQPMLPNILSSVVGGSIDFGLDYVSFGGEFFDDVTLIAIRAHGQYISPQGHGGYLTLPGFYGSGNNDSESGVGNIELGGLYAMRQGPSTDILLRGGIALDTAGQVGAFFTPITHIAPRLGDAYVTGLSTTWARLQAQLRHTAGAVHFGGSAGFDLPINSDEELGDFDGLAVLALSAGFTQGTFGASAGLVMLQAIGTNDDDANLLGANAMVDFEVAPNARLFGLFGISLEDDADAFSIGAGVRFAL